VAGGTGVNCFWPSRQRIVPADKHHGMIADGLCDDLYARSTGHIGSLMTLINRG
jgi:hypothetical protein